MWRDIVRVFVQAGRGLAAAHAAGVVHRDFKPSYVVVGRDGRVRVLDFGLARISGEPAPDRERAVLGTPAYMAPEQRRGEVATERSDQFSFCVALHEVLDGAPVRVQRILQRGMQDDPAARFASMSELVDKLDAALQRRRLAAIPIASIAVVVACVTIGTAPKPAEPCAGAERHLTGIWDPASKREVAAAFRTSAMPFADHASRTAERLLDSYANEWVGTRTAACKATRIVREQTETQMALRMVCLDRRLQELDALVDRLRTADASTVTKAVHAVQALPSIAACSDLAALSQSVPPPTNIAARATVARIRRELADATSLLDLGKYAEGAPLAIDAVNAARAIAYRPVEAEALWVHASFQARLGDYEASKQTFTKPFARRRAVATTRSQRKRGSG